MSDDTTQLPVGTRIRFLKTLESGPDDYGPGNHYATKGQLGTVAESSYGPDAGPPKEGHWVFWDGWTRAQFGAELGKDFEVVEPESQGLAATIQKARGGPAPPIMQRGFA